MTFRVSLASVLALALSAAGCIAAGPPAEAASATVHNATVTVPAASASVVDTGLSYSPGGTLRITATGTATYGPEGQPFCAGVPVTTPDGTRSVNGVPCPPKLDPSATLPTAPIGSLIASIGIPGEPCSTGWFYTGNNLPVDRFGAGGEIYLLYNDSIGHYGDNTGSYTAHVAVTPAAHPPKEDCGKVVDLEIRQTPQTPLWSLHTVVTLNPVQISCPATVTVASGLLSDSAPACGDGDSAATTVSVQFPVFDAVGAALQPDAKNPFTVSITDTHGTDVLKKSLAVPPAPVWYGLGDSYSSAFRLWKADENDRPFSWVSRATVALNSHFAVPPEWQITPRILAQSGATTDAMATGQLTAAAQELGRQLNSWNFASVTGGGNDADFAGPAFTEYETEVLDGKRTALNDITDAQQCPDKPINPDRPNDPTSLLTILSNSANQQENAIASNLATIFTNLRDTDPDIHLVDVTYPYVVDAASACLSSDPGVKEIIDALDSAHAQADQSVSGVLPVDLRTVFGAYPVGSGLINAAGPGLIPGTLNYPHPTDAGQQEIANAAASAVEQANG
jgi:hypothetical protein